MNDAQVVAALETVNDYVPVVTAILVGWIGVRAVQFLRRAVG